MPLINNFAALVFVKQRVYQYKVNPNRKSIKPSGSNTHLGRRIKGDGRHTAT